MRCIYVLAEVLIRPCDIHAVFESPSDEMYKTIKLSWSSNKKLPGVHNYTVFWCERETETEEKRCKDKVRKLCWIKFLRNSEHN